jgi:hypothetical protein
MAAYLLSVFLFVVTCDPRPFGLDWEREGRGLVHRENPTIIGLAPRQNHNPPWQTLLAPKHFTGPQFEVDLVGALLGPLALLANAVEIALFLLLHLRDLGSETIVGVQTQIPRIGADPADALGTPRLWIFDDVKGRKSLVHSLFELEQDFINAQVHWLKSFSERGTRLARSK